MVHDQKPADAFDFASETNVRKLRFAFGLAFPDTVAPKARYVSPVKGVTVCRVDMTGWAPEHVTFVRGFLSGLAAASTTFLDVGADPMEP